MEARIKLTKTMLDKHIIDANNSVREFVKNVGVVFDDMASGESVTMMVSRSNTNYSITWPTIKWVGGSQPILPTGSTAYAIITVWKADTTLFGSYGGDAS